MTWGKRDEAAFWTAVVLETVAYAVLATVAFALCGLVLAGCPCPTSPAVPPRVVLVSKPCPLPPTPSLPVLQTVDAGDPKLFCYDMPRALLLAQRDSIMRAWIKEVVARCSNGGASDAGVASDARSPNRRD